MTAKQRNAIILFTTTNLSNGDIAKEIGVSKATISNWLKNDEFLTELEKANRRALNKAASIAQQKIVELINNSNPCVALSACKDILDRAGYKPIEKAEISTPDINITIDYGDDEV